jgi:mono/diheme cytochrome c family protein
VSRLARLGLLLVVALAACGGEERPATPAPQPPSESSASVAPVAPMPESPAAAAPAPAALEAATASPVAAVQPPSPPATTGFRVPSGPLRGDANRGGTLYAQFCSSCHGLTGAGDGPASLALNPKPANHTDTQFMGGLSDEHLYTVIHQGAAAVGKSPLMVGWGAVIPDRDIRDLIAHLRRMSGT